MALSIAFVGCGYVADFYMGALPNSSDHVTLRGVWDRDSFRLKQFCDFYDQRSYESYEALLGDPDVAIVVNLTNPGEHYTTSRAALEAGKHVYSEKPLAMDLAEAQALCALAEERGLHIAAAPCSVLGEAAQTLWRAVRTGVAGKPRLVYGELDDGMVHRIGCEAWRSASGAPWPAKDEFLTGCTVEHAGYILAWLVAMFGPVERMVSAAALLEPDKGAETPSPYTTPDFSVGVLEFAGGVVARLTNSIIAHHDHHLRVMCSEGELAVGEVWDLAAPVRFTPLATNRWKRRIGRTLGLSWRRTVPPARRCTIQTGPKAANMDFSAGLAEMAAAIDAGKTPRLSGGFALHVTEVTLALQHPERFGAEYRPVSRFDPMEPMPWAE